MRGIYAEMSRIHAFFQSEKREFQSCADLELIAPANALGYMVLTFEV